MAQEAKILPASMGLLRDSHSKVLFVPLSCLQAALRVPHLSLEMVEAFYHVVSYILAFCSIRKFLKLLLCLKS